MENRITVSICGTEYTLMAEESPAYMQKVAAMNIADEMLKQQGSTENLRAQLKGYLDEASRAKNELSECKREIFRLQQQLSKR